MHAMAQIENEGLLGERAISPAQRILKPLAGGAANVMQPRSSNMFFRHVGLVRMRGN